MTSAVFGAIFGAVCGASTAGTATVGLLSLPEMIKREYQAGMARCHCRFFREPFPSLIPPSVILILYGTLANESIGALFAGGIIPGVLMTILALGYIFIRVLVDPKVAPRGRCPVHLGRKNSVPSGGVWSLLAVVVVLLFYHLHRCCHPNGSQRHRLYGSVYHCSGKGDFDCRNNQKGP